MKRNFPRFIRNVTYFIPSFSGIALNRIWIWAHRLSLVRMFVYDKAPNRSNNLATAAETRTYDDARSPHFINSATFFHMILSLHVNQLSLCPTVNEGFTSRCLHSLRAVLLIIISANQLLGTLIEWKYASSKLQLDFFSSSFFLFRKSWLFGLKNLDQDESAG